MRKNVLVVLVCCGAFLAVPLVNSQGIGFDATFPTEGRYRLFLQFKVGGVVHTARFTVEVAR